MKNKKGSILAYSLIILTMMTAIVSALSINTIIAKKSASGTENSIQTFQVADSGVQLALKKINKELERAVPRNIRDIFTCDANGVVVDNADAGAPGSGASYDVSFFDRYGNPLPCSNAVSEISNIKAIGRYRDTVRAVDVGIGFRCGTSVAYNGDIYKTILIGSQCWFAENLRTPKKSDGMTALTLGTDYFCYVGDPNCATPGGGNNDTNLVKYGALYTWKTAMSDTTSRSVAPGPQGVCPIGWHVPTDGEIKTLEMALGMTQTEADKTELWRGTDEGIKMKSGGTSKFNLPLAGFGDSGGQRDVEGYFWSATQDTADVNTAFVHEVSSSKSKIYHGLSLKTKALSVRCISD